MRTLPLLSGFFQICYVTKDLDAGMRRLTAIHGIERFRIKRNVQSLPGMPKMLVHEAWVSIGAIQLELIQPAGGDDALYRDFCAVDSGAIRHHHHGMWVDDAAEYANLKAALAEQNIPVAFNASLPNIGGVIYADTRAELGHYLEYLHLTPEVKRTYYADVPQHSSGSAP